MLPHSAALPFQSARIKLHSGFELRLAKTRYCVQTALTLYNYLVNIPMRFVRISVTVANARGLGLKQ